MKNQLLRKLFVRGYSRISTAFYHLTDRLFQGKHRWIELKNAHDFPFVGQKGGFERIDPDMLFGCSKGVCAAAKASAGGVIEFITDGSVIELSVVMKQYLSAFDQPQMPLSSYAGIDIYVKNQEGYFWKGNFTPNRWLGAEMRYTVRLCEDTAKKMHQVMLYLPIMTPVSSVRIGILPEDRLLPVQSPKLKIGVYGSSITQGCACSRPGMSYVSQLGRMLDARMINLGFSGSAKGEQKIANMIAAIELDVLIIEYDHNATLEELKKTHWEFFQTIRKAKPALPVIFLSRISGGISASIEETENRRQVILDTIRRAKEQGDQRVWFVDGMKINRQHESGCLLADDRHPNDLGMTMIARQLAEAVRSIVEK